MRTYAADVGIPGIVEGFISKGTFWIDRLDVSGKMVNIEDDECNPVSSSKTRRDRSYPRTIDEEPKNTFFGWAGRHSRLRYLSEVEVFLMKRVAIFPNRYRSNSSVLGIDHQDVKKGVAGKSSILELMQEFFTTRFFGLTQVPKNDLVDATCEK